MASSCGSPPIVHVVQLVASPRGISCREGGGSPRTAGSDGCARGWTRTALPLPGRHRAGRHEVTCVNVANTRGRHVPCRRRPPPRLHSPRRTPSGSQLGRADPHPTQENRRIREPARHARTAEHTHTHASYARPGVPCGSCAEGPAAAAGGGGNLCSGGHGQGEPGHKATRPRGSPNPPREHASPAPSLSPSSCVGLYTVGQLSAPTHQMESSAESHTPSTSVSTCPGPTHVGATAADTDRSAQAAHTVRHTMHTRAGGSTTKPARSHTAGGGNHNSNPGLVTPAACRSPRHPPAPPAP
jgi:hypothetical protein